MGTEYWLVDKNREIKFYLGKLGGEQIFMNYVKTAEEIMDFFKEDLPEIKSKIYSEEGHNLKTTKLQDLTVGQLSFLLDCKKKLEKLPMMDRNLLPFIYFVKEIEGGARPHYWDYYGDLDREKVEKYEDYLEIGNPHVEHHLGNEEELKDG